METLRNNEINRGMELVSGLSEIMPDEADDQVRLIYEDIKNTFRVPIVNFFFRVLANYPSYLVPAWNGFSPCLRTMKFERVADDLRSAALLESVPDSAGLQWPSEADLSSIRAFTDTIHYLLPKLLLVATAFHQDLITSGGIFGRDTAARAEEITPGIAAGTASIPMVSPGGPGEMLRMIFEDIKERHGHPEVATYYRSLGHWPGFLLGVWERIKPLVRSPKYMEKKRTLLEQTLRALEVHCPTRRDTSVHESLSSRELEEIRPICAVFRFRLVSDLLLDVSLIKAMLDGPDAARISRFSFRSKSLAR